jgi:hypothetical protein
LSSSATLSSSISFIVIIFLSSCIYLETFMTASTGSLLSSSQDFLSFSFACFLSSRLLDLPTELGVRFLLPSSLEACLLRADNHPVGNPKRKVWWAQ